MMIINFWRTTEVKAGQAKHLQPAKIYASIEEEIDGVTYTARRETVIHADVTYEEQSEIFERMANECRDENRFNAKLDAEADFFKGYNAPKITQPSEFNEVYLFKTKPE